MNKPVVFGLCLFLSLSAMAADSILLSSAVFAAKEPEIVKDSISGKYELLWDFKFDLGVEIYEPQDTCQGTITVSSANIVAFDGSDSCLVLKRTRTIWSAGVFEDVFFCIFNEGLPKKIISLEFNRQNSTGKSLNWARIEAGRKVLLIIGDYHLTNTGILVKKIQIMWSEKDGLIIDTSIKANQGLNPSLSFKKHSKSVFLKKGPIIGQINLRGRRVYTQVSGIFVY